MNNLHRELAPISDAAWAQIEQEVARTFRRNLAGRRVVDVELAESGRECSAIGTGHLKALKAPQEGVIARQRIVMPLVGSLLVWHGDGPPIPTELADDKIVRHRRC